MKSIPTLKSILQKSHSNPFFLQPTREMEWLEALSGDVALCAVGVVAALVLLYPVFFSLVRGGKTVKQTLYIRNIDYEKLDPTGKKGNVFMNEFNLLFLAMVHILDYAVMKYVTDCPLLVKQEHLHAKMHIKGQKNKKAEGDELKRFLPLAKAFDLLLLRLGRTIGVSVACAVESTSAHLLYYASSTPFLKDWESDVLLIHFLEEIEHGLLTVQSIKKQTYFVVRLLLYPLMVLLWAITCVYPLLSTFIANPSLLIKPSTLPQMIQYIGILGFACITVEWAMFSLWLMPFVIDDFSEHKKKYAYYEARLNERKIPFQIVDQADYDLYAIEY